MSETHIYTHTHTPTPKTNKQNWKTPQSAEKQTPYGFFIMATIKSFGTKSEEWCYLGEVCIRGNQ